MEKTLYEYIRKAVKALKGTVVLNDGVSEDSIRDSVSKIYDDSPQLFWFSGRYFYEGERRILTLRYDLSAESTKRTRKAIVNLLNSYFHISELKKLPEPVRVVTVLTLLKKYVRITRTGGARDRSICGPLIDRIASPRSLARVTAWLLSQCEIEASIANGIVCTGRMRGYSHWWNIVTIYGRSANFDCSGVIPECFNHGRSNEYVSRYVSIDSHSSSKIPTVEITLPAFVDTGASPSEIKSGRVVGCRPREIYNIPSDKNKMILSYYSDISGVNEYEVYVIERTRGLRHTLKIYDEQFQNVGLLVEQASSLEECVRACPEIFDEKELLHMMRDLLEGLRDFQQRGFTYEGINIHNVFRTNDGTYKWGPTTRAFDSSVIRELPAAYTDSKGRFTVNKLFMSPETVRLNVFDDVSAIYSLSLIVYSIIRGRLLNSPSGIMMPFMNSFTDLDGAFSRRISGETIFMDDITDRYPVLARILASTLNSDRRQRPHSFDHLASLMDGVVPPVLNVYDYFPVDRKSASIQSGISFFEYMHTINERINERVESLKQTVCRGFEIAKETTSEIVRPFVSDSIRAVVYAPSMVLPGMSVRITAFIFKCDLDKVLKRTVAIKHPGLKPNGQLDFKAIPGEKILYELHYSDGRRKGYQSRSSVWNGKLGNISFDVPMSDNTIGLDATLVLHVVHGRIKDYVGCLNVHISAYGQSQQGYARVEAQPNKRAFISYARKDGTTFARTFHASFNTNGNYVFLDTENLRAGELFNERIRREIERCDEFILIWTDAAALSPEVAKEWKYALNISSFNRRPMIKTYCYTRNRPIPSAIFNKYNVEYMCR